MIRHAEQFARSPMRIGRTIIEFDSAAKPPIFGKMGFSARENLNDFNTHFF